MIEPIQEVLTGSRRWWVEASDALEFLKRLPDRCVSMFLCSPPYLGQRTYGIDFDLDDPEDWVRWMIPIVVEACRVCDGLVFINMSAPVRNYSYQPAPEFLVADLVRYHGVVVGSAPHCYFRHGVPGSGGKHYHRRDWEPVYSFAFPDRLPPRWSDNTALGHPPRWAPGGEMSNRLSNGARVNQWGAGVDADGKANKGGRRNANGAMRGREVTPSHEVQTVGEPDLTPGLFGPQEPESEGPDVNQWGGHETTGRSTRKNGSKQPPGRPSHVSSKQRSTSRKQGSDERKDEIYWPPVLANPGNLIQEKYTMEQVRQLLMGGDLGGPVVQGSPGGDVIRCLVGGGHMGHAKAHESEAPFSEVLCEYLIRSYAAPDSIVGDFFSGSGTVGAVAVRWGRRFLGCDLRESQTKVARERIEGETLPLPGMEG